MVKLVEKVTWKKISYEIVWRREWDLPGVYCNPSKTNKVLWWKAEVSEEGV